ncbi:copper transporter [Calderihabitans maritimus]|uniref:Copper transporter n=1 Tax=Calderihabitans maritimus TaxID=1246530 RepID=A0A1Z5HSS1_9FIRM|nr:copper transporter [Calderihabitans maritimus]GAW92397.1 hypothetical protein Desku_1918 [Calderihabitans maritimus]
MMDLKYHIASLVAVFLALGIGILVGSTVIGDDLIVKEQKELIDRLEGDFAKLREQNQIFQRELAATRSSAETYQEFAEKIFPLLVADRLKGMKVAVVGSGASINELQNLTDSLKLAGAEICSITGVADPSLQDKDKLFTMMRQLGLATFQELLSYLGHSVGKAIAEKDATAKASLEHFDLVETIGSYDNEVDAVVLVGRNGEGTADLVKFFTLSLIKILQQQQIEVIGTQLSGGDSSFLTHYQKLHIKTVSNIDTVPGMTDLVFMLQKYRADYEERPAAEKLLPAGQ